MSDKNDEIIELNVGGMLYTTTLNTLQKNKTCLLAKMFSESSIKTLPCDADRKYFIDRDGALFRYILDYLRNTTLILPDNFNELERLKREAEYFELPDMVKSLNRKNSFISQGSSLNTNAPGPAKGRPSGVIVIGYRGTFSAGRDGHVDVKFRKLARIIVSGKVSLCREVFEDTLNESRDPDHGVSDRYTARFFLKHAFVEQAMDMLFEKDFYLVGCSSSGTNSCGDVKPGLDIEESKWQHYNEFVFARK